MKGKAAMMGATIVMVAAVAMVFLVLLAELYCTLLLRKRRRHPNTAASTPTDARRHPCPASSLCSFYAQGVIRAPRSFLFPAAEPPPQPESPNSDKQVFHNNLRYSSARLDHRETVSPDSPTTSAAAAAAAEQLMYICNPMYDGDEGIIGDRDTPFETPGSSPSHLDIEAGSSGGASPEGSAPPLAPMKKLQEEDASVSLRDGRSICTTPSDSNTIFGGVSSSSSASPYTSPSW